jgi:hypothetical protein
MPRSRYRMYENQAPHFLTCTVVNGLPPFSSRPVVDILYVSWRFLQAHERLTIYAYVRQEPCGAAWLIGGGAGVVTRSVEMVFPRSVGTSASQATVIP